jgi:hypothetical protein
MNTTQYTKEYFIAKFEAIPSEEIGRGSIDDKCALFHTGAAEGDLDYILTDEARALIELFGGKGKNGKEYDAWVVVDVNDRLHYLGATPKERILNKLKSL